MTDGSTPYERVMARVVQRGECLESPASPDDHGYSRVMVRTDAGLRPRFAHRIVWEHHNGVIPDGLGVLHRCDNPPCVRIEHLFLGTQGDNIVDMAEKGRHHNQQKTHCPKGHEYTEENTYIPRPGWRECRICRTASDRKRRAREKRERT